MYPKSRLLPQAFYCEISRGSSISGDQWALILKDARTARREANLIVDDILKETLKGQSSTFNRKE